MFREEDYGYAFCSSKKHPYWNTPQLSLSTAFHAASDLVATVASPPASLTTGAKFSLPTTVTNQGTAASPKTTITYYPVPGSSKDNAWLLSSKRSVKGLAPRMCNLYGKGKGHCPFRHPVEHL